MRSALILSATIATALAQQPVWGQCGGNNWTGLTTCEAGSYCKVSNEWYSQCVPGTASSAVPTTVRTTTKATSSPTKTTTQTVSTRPPNPGSTAIPSAKGTKFVIDGETKYFAGTNCYWCSFLTKNADVDLVFDHLQSSGLKILRIWGFNDVNTLPGTGTVYFQHLTASGSTINTGADGLQRLDYVVAAAEKRGIKLIINFVNNWDDYGGMKAYTTAFGGDHLGWYTNAAAQTQYRKYIKAVVSRYASSPGVFAWELANEPRCQQCNTDVIYNWAKSASEYVKSLDSKHMVTLGDEGMGLPGDTAYPYTYYEGTDFVKNLEIDTLDFGTYHLYPDHWGTSIEFGNQWVEDHAAACAAAGKPCMFEEYGAMGDHCALQRQWQKTSVAAAGSGADLFWQFGDTTSNGKSHDDGFTVYYDSADWKCLVTDHVSSIG
jgi:mannan endo-1,4-beta-mannosidase